MVSMADFKMMKARPAAGIAAPAKQAQLYTTGQGTPLSYNANFAANTQDEPYTVAPGSQFRLFRSRCIGGRTNHYSRVQLRYSDYDFKPRSMTGVGWDWPSATGLAPYYDKAERLIGVTGKPEGIRSAPDGIFQEPGAAQAARSARSAGVREARNPRHQRAAGGHHQSPERPAGVSLLRAMRTRMLASRLELLVELRADLSGDEDGPCHKC